MILDGKSLAAVLKEEIKNEVINLKKQNINPKLVVIQIGKDDASNVYIKNKQKACEYTEILFEHLKFPENVNLIELEKKINELNDDKTVNGILIQSPLPKHLNETEIFNLVNPLKDVDGFTEKNMGKLVENQSGLIPCTPKGILKLLTHYEISLEGKHVVVVGRSNIVGKPMSLLALNKNATVTICHSKTKNLKEFTKQADILISAVGIPKFIKEDMVKDNAVIIDVGINRENGILVGDVDYKNVSKKSSFITPVPGGVGPLTIASLLENVLIASKKQNKS